MECSPLLTIVFAAHTLYFARGSHSHSITSRCRHFRHRRYEVRLLCGSCLLTEEMYCCLDGAARAHRTEQRASRARLCRNDHIRLVDLIDPELRERADVLVQERLAGREAEDALQQGVANAAANAGAEPELQATPENAESACVPGGCGERGEFTAEGSSATFCNVARGARYAMTNSDASAAAGTCNEFTGECDCIVGWIGETCDRLASESPLATRVPARLQRQ